MDPWSTLSKNFQIIFCMFSFTNILKHGFSVLLILTILRPKTFEKQEVKPIILTFLQDVGVEKKFFSR
jgi:hypothetical protein